MKIILTMKTYQYFILLFLVAYNSQAQQAGLDLTKDDIKPSQNSSFSTQNDIEGIIQNSVQEVTGKVNLSIPITTVKARSVSYPITRWRGNVFRA